MPAQSVAHFKRRFKVDPAAGLKFAKPGFCKGFCRQVNRKTVRAQSNCRKTTPRHGNAVANVPAGRLEQGTANFKTAPLGNFIYALNGAHGLNDSGKHRQILINLEDGKESASLTRPGAPACAVCKGGRQTERS